MLSRNVIYQARDRFANLLAGDRTMSRIIKTRDVLQHIRRSSQPPVITLFDLVTLHKSHVFV